MPDYLNGCHVMSSATRFAMNNRASSSSLGGCRLVDSLGLSKFNLWCLFRNRSQADRHTANLTYRREIPPPPRVPRGEGMVAPVAELVQSYGNSRRFSIWHKLFIEGKKNTFKIFIICKTRPDLISWCISWMGRILLSSRVS